MPHGLSAWPWWLLLSPFWLLLWCSWRALGRWQARLPEGLEKASDSWYLLCDERREAAVPTGEWLLWPWLQCLRLQPVSGEPEQVIICLPDSASAEERRRLRQWMRLPGPVDS